MASVPKLVCLLYCNRYKLKRQGLELAREMEMQVHDGGCVSYHDWKFMCSTIGYMK